MSEEILINVTPQETRVAVVENGVLQELFIERERARGIVGNVYKGTVCRVLPGMQAAFVDIGLDRAAFLHASDIDRNDDRSNGCSELKELKPEVIDRLVKDGQQVIVQVVKDPLGTKGARLTTNITIPSRYLVFLPAGDGVGISTKIENEEERQRLKDLVTSGLDDAAGGYIVRTAAEYVEPDAIVADMAFLQKMWRAINEKVKTAEPSSLVHADLPLAVRVQRDLVNADVEKVRIDSRESYTRVTEFVQQFHPEMVSRVEHYPGARPIFDLYDIENEIQKALERRVGLKSGGYLIIDQTEAMTTIDVNTGAYVGHRNLEETIFKTNLEATQAIARQLRLRNLGGIIIIDFIDMTQEEHKRQVLRALERSLERDHSKSTITEVSALGLVEMTRKRTRESLEHVLCEPCPCCSGRGSLKTPETVCYEVFREILREARQYDDIESFLVFAAQIVVDRLEDDESPSVAELQAFIDKPIRFQSEPLYTQEQFDVVLM